MKVRTVQLVGGGLLALLLAVLAGWVWGAWGASGRERERREVEVRLALTEARSRVLQAQLGFHRLAFDEARRRLGTAKRPLDWARSQLQARGRTDLARRLTEALAYVAEAQVLSVQLDPAGSTRARAAIEAIDAVLRVAPGSPGRWRPRRRNPRVSET